MVPGPHSPHSRRSGAIFAISLLLCLSFAANFAEAREYGNNLAHFHLTVPDGWNVSEGLESASFEEFPQSFCGPYLLVGAQYVADARNEGVWLLDRIQITCENYRRSYNGTYVVAPLAFETGGGRPAAQCAFDYALGRGTMRHRIVDLSSDFYNTTYEISMSAERGMYLNLTEVWDTAVNSFWVDGEPFFLTPGLLLRASGVALAAVVALTGFTVWQRRRRPRPLREAQRAPEQPDPPLAPCSDCGELMPIGSPACPRCGLEFDGV